MHLRNVEIFCEVVARGSFSKAADAHKVSQSSASQAVHMLEKRLGCRLIDRSKRPFELTPAGQIYYEGCRKILESFRNIEDRVQQMRNKVVGRVRVAAIYSVGLLQMDAYVKRYETLYPDATLQIEYLHPDDVYSRIAVDEADLGLVSFPRDGGEISCIPWQEQEFVLVVSPRHRLAGRGSVALSEIDGEDFVGFTPDLTIRKQLDRWLKQSKVSVNIVHAFDNIENIKRAVEIGSGVGLLPAPTVRREFDAGLLDIVHIDGQKWFRPLGIVHKRNRTLTTAANKLIELLHEDPDTFQKIGRESHSADKVRAS
jgi:DNA-binding transcriptional LysR family regulator